VPTRSCGACRLSSRRSSTARSSGGPLHRREPEELGVDPICKLLQVAPSSYYVATPRPPSASALRDALLTPVLVALWSANYRVYGARKLWRAARRAGDDVGRDPVARLMDRVEIEGAAKGQEAPHETRSRLPPGTPTRFGRRFVADRPQRLWVTDLT